MISCGFCMRSKRIIASVTARAVVTNRSNYRLSVETTRRSSRLPSRIAGQPAVSLSAKKERPRTLSRVGWRGPTLVAVVNDTHSSMK